MNKEQPAIGIVVIGRNEGERLRVCLRSVLGAGRAVVYVDSGSIDGSVALARSLGATVVALDMAVPFTAARARNAGFEALRALSHGVQFVQFVDGDCEMAAGWLHAALDFLTSPGHARYAVVCGRRRERFPEKSVYNRLCDIEWNTPIGDAKACGGDAMMRVSALATVGGFRDDLIAGEEPELCVRLRAAGWKIHRLDAEMALHDAAMLHWRQWWRRSVRGGYAFAQGSWLHGGPPERHWVQETRRALAWGLALPIAIVLAAGWVGAGAMWLLLLYPAQVLRLMRRGGGAERAFFLVAGKFAEAAGIVQFAWNRLMHRRQHIIEYK
ncbi:MAG: glycosyl transferase [Comamonas sp. SCN 65-56]|uniref:glycosyltransferase n=1 Tax=Comamonas sp. SCN 65-56 TaxID=1660095 RepID=UPI00086D4258|nr:glycosyltransferase [Comamonas sp. SCN 65-56]ODS93813.1 MAG: glycosyl transferase [Comamonas sp. SCN 65-56]